MISLAKASCLILLLLVSGCLERVVLVGDSTTACFARFNPAISANALLDPNRWVVTNRAIPAQTSEDWLNRWADETLAIYPQSTAIITIGVNDWLIGLTPEESVANIVELSRRFQKVYVTGLHVVDPTGSVIYHAEYLEWRGLLQDQLDAEGITSWDWGSFEKDDGLHHTDIGCEALGVQIGTEILNLQ